MRRSRRVRLPAGRSPRAAVHLVRAGHGALLHTDRRRGERPRAESVVACTSCLLILYVERDRDCDGRAAAWDVAGAAIVQDGDKVARVDDSTAAAALRLHGSENGEDRAFATLRHSLPSSHWGWIAPRPHKRYGSPSVIGVRHSRHTGSHGAARGCGQIPTAVIPSWLRAPPRARRELGHAGDSGRTWSAGVGEHRRMG